MTEAAAPAAPSKRYWIGSSDIAAIMGISPFTTPLQAWMKITGQAPELEAEELEFFAGRKALEPYVIQKLGSKFGVIPCAQNMRYSHPDFPFCRAEIDAEEHDANYEIKTVHPSRAQDWGDAYDSFPIYVAAQTQFGLAVRPKRRAYATPCIGFDIVKRYEVEPDLEVQQSMLSAADLFWHVHVLPKVPPPPRTIEDCLSLFPKSMRDPILATDEIYEHVVQMKRLSDSIKQFEQEKDSHSFAVRSFMGACDELIRQGVGKIATYRSNKDTEVVEWEAIAHVYETTLREFMIDADRFFATTRAANTITKPGARPFRNCLK